MYGPQWGDIKKISKVSCDGRCWFRILFTGAPCRSTGAGAGVKIASGSEIEIWACPKKRRAGWENRQGGRL